MFQLIEEETKALLHILTAIFGKLLSILGNNDSSVDFTYLNGRKGCMLIIPQVKSLPALMNQTRGLRWIDSMLDHLAGPGFDQDAPSEWLFYTLGIKYGAAYILV